MPAPSDPVIVALISALGVSILGPVINSLFGDRLARRRKKEELDATLSQAALTDGAATRAELWVRIRELEATNKELRGLPRGVDPDTLKAYEELDERRRARIDELEAERDKLEERFRQLERELAKMQPQG